MKILHGFMFMLLIISFYPGQAQYNTGDADLDKILVNLDLEASLSFGAFRANVARIYHLTDSNIQYLTVEIGMTAGDIFLTLEMIRITQKSLNEVVETYQNNRKNGWGAIALELGVLPGSDKFVELKDELKRHA